MRTNMARLCGLALSNPDQAVSALGDVAVGAHAGVTNARLEALRAGRQENPGEGARVTGQGAVAGAVAYGIANLDGARQAERDFLVQVWQSEVAPSLGVSTKDFPEPFQDVPDANGNLLHAAFPDPQRRFGVSKLAAVPVVAGSLAIVGFVAADKAEDEDARKRRMFFGHVCAGTAVGGLCYVLGEHARHAEYKRSLEAMENGTLVPEEVKKLRELVAGQATPKVGARFRAA